MIQSQTNCDALKWATAQRLPVSQYALLCFLAGRSDAGRVQVSKAEIAAHLFLKERQVYNLLAALVSAGLIEKHPDGGVGQGRKANAYLLAIGNRLPETGCYQQPVADSATGNAFPAMHCTGQPVAWQPIADRGNRQSPPKNNIKPPVVLTSTVGSSSENPETCGEGGSGEEGRSLGLFAEPAPPQAVAKPSRKKPVSAMRTDWRPSPEAMAYAADKGLVNGWCEATLENFRDYWISKGEQRADWDATWRSNVRNEVQYKRNLPRGSKTPAQAKYRNGVRRNIYIEAIRSEQP